MAARRKSKAAPPVRTKKKLDFSLQRDRTQSGKVGLRRRMP